jgi:hypothetical protein
MLFGVAQPGLESTIYRTRVGSPNQYTTNLVGPILKDDLFFICIYENISVVVFLCEAKLACHKCLLLFLKS